MDKTTLKYTLTVTTFESLGEEELKDLRENRDRNRGMNYNAMGPDYIPERPLNAREVRVMTVQLTHDEFQAVKRAAVEAIK